MHQTDQKLLFLSPLLAMFVAAFIFQIGLFAFSFLTLDSWEERGQFGDGFGFISAIFSGFALCGIIYSIAIQMHEQIRQRREAHTLIETELALRKALSEALTEQTIEIRALWKAIESRSTRRVP